MSKSAIDGDVMACGCFWTRDTDWGDVLTQCARHKAGAHYEGAEPMTPDEEREFAEGLAAALGTKVIVRDSGD